VTTHLEDKKKIGVILGNVGSPAAPDTESVRVYLKQFLMDPFIIDLPWPLRAFLVYGIILPRRPAKSAEAYQKIWTDKGSPLIVYTKDLVEAVQEQLGDAYVVRMAMGVGSPSTPDVMNELATKGIERIILAPLFPQHANATTGAVTHVARKTQKQIPGLQVDIWSAFYKEPDYVRLWADLIKKHLADYQADALLMSYHGLPQKQIIKANAGCAGCVDTESCHRKYEDSNCYRAQCYATTELIKAEGDFQLPIHSSFQSRLGRAAWAKPYTDEVLPKLYEDGVRHLAIACPAFVTDCLETLEEVEMGLGGDWLAQEGTSFKMVPSLNAQEAWAALIARWVQRDAAL
jgi:protoporphyrin/coproporphyrin ferrochelatase